MAARVKQDKAPAATRSPKSAEAREEKKLLQKFASVPVARMPAVLGSSLRLAQSLRNAGVHPREHMRETADTWRVISMSRCGGAPGRLSSAGSAVTR